MMNVKPNLSMRSNTVQTGERFKIDSYQVSQYEGQRVVDAVEVLDPFHQTTKTVLVYSPLLKANVLVKKSELKRIIL